MIKFDRQGDVYVDVIHEIPDLTGFKPVVEDNGKIILAYGEKTGHHHYIPAEDIEFASMDDNGVMFLRVIRDSVLTHYGNDHSPIPVKAGNYFISIQKEYTPGAIKRVVD